MGEQVVALKGIIMIHSGNIQIRVFRSMNLDPDPCEMAEHSDA